MNIGLIATYTAAVLTVMIFSYLLGDNFLYRIAVHLLVGAAAGYALIVAVESVIIPWVKFTLIGGFANPNFVIGLIPLLVGVLLAFKISPRLSRFGNLGLAFVMGVGGAVAIVGAVNGTLLPLATNTARSFTPADALNGFIALLGTLSTLIYFTYWGIRRSSGEVERPKPIQFIGWFGKVFIVVTLGATFALVILSTLTVFTDVIVNRLLVLKPG